MKISVVIIAHNEEQYIQKCIDSVVNQTVMPQEIIVVLHNCTDETFAIASAASRRDSKKVPITLIPFKGPAGIIHARIEGIEQTNGDLILCIDGDSYAARNWVEVLSKLLYHDYNNLVGSWVKYNGTLFGKMSNFLNKISCVSHEEKATRWVWGPSFGFRKTDKQMVIDFLRKSQELSASLELSRNPDDYWLAVCMFKAGKKIVVTNETSVTQHTKETSNKEAFLRNKENLRNGKIIRSYLQMQ